MLAERQALGVFSVYCFNFLKKAINISASADREFLEGAGLNEKGGGQVAAPTGNCGCDFHDREQPKSSSHRQQGAHKVPPNATEQKIPEKIICFEQGKIWGFVGLGFWLVFGLVFFCFFFSR